MILVLSFFSLLFQEKTYFLARLLVKIMKFKIKKKKIPLTISDFKMPLTFPFHLISRVFYLCVVY